MMKSTLAVGFLLSSSLAAFGAGNVTLTDQNSQYFGTASNPIFVQLQGGGGGAGSTGSVTATQSGAWSVSISNFPATQPVSGTITANLGTLNGAALDTSVQAVKTALGSPFQAGGSIGNTAFALNAGSALVGKFGIDQTTPGTTNKVTLGSDNVAVLPSGQYVTGRINFLGYNGSSAILQQDAAGQLKISESGSNDPNIGIVPAITQAGTSVVGKASPGNLYGAYAINTTTTAGYLILINATAAPSSGTAITPVEIAPLAGTIGAAASVNYGAGPPNAYSTGIVALISTSITTYTPGGNAFIQARVR